MDNYSYAVMNNITEALYRVDSKNNEMKCGRVKSALDQRYLLY